MGPSRCWYQSGRRLEFRKSLDFGIVTSVDTDKEASDRKIRRLRARDVRVLGDHSRFRASFQFVSFQPRFHAEHVLFDRKISARNSCRRLRGFRLNVDYRCSAWRRFMGITYKYMLRLWYLVQWDIIAGNTTSKQPIKCGARVLLVAVPFSRTTAVSF